MLPKLLSRGRAPLPKDRLKPRRRALKTGTAYQLEGETATTLVLSFLRDGVNTSGRLCLAGSHDEDLGF